MRTIAIIALAGCASISTGKRKWTGQDIALETGFVGATLLDTESTYWASRMPYHECGESNPITGPCGDRVPLAVYTPVVLVGHAVAAHYLPRPYRTLFQALTLGFESAVVYGNYVLGYGVDL